MGVLSGNLRGRTRFARYRHRLVDTLNARLPDRAPPRRGKRVEPSCPEHLAQSGAIRRFVAVRTRRVGRRSVTPPSSPNPQPGPNHPGLRQRSHPALDRSGLRWSPRARGYPSPALDRFSPRRSDPARRLEGGLSVNQALGVSPRSQIGALNRVRPRRVGGQSAYRAAANVSTGTDSRHHPPL